MPKRDVSHTKNIVINGRFLSQDLSGVQRYAREIVKALDRLIAANPNELGVIDWRLAVPVGTNEDLYLEHIPTFKTGSYTGHLWEQIDLYRAARQDRLVNLGNSGPLLHRDSLVIIHDAAPYRTPHNFGARYGAFHRTMGRLLARTSRIGTVSNFSREELAAVLCLDPTKIAVAGNGCDHLLGRPRNTNVIDRLEIVQGRYFLFVGSPTPNKNLPVALEAFRLMNRADVQFVVAGSLNKTVFGGTPLEMLPGVILATRLTDPEIASLYANAAALVFPSRYEGFGIPPLEAMTCECPVIASDIPVVREVCGDAAAYFPLDDAAALANLMVKALDPQEGLSFFKAAAAERIAHFTWERAALALTEAILPQIKLSSGNTS